MTHESHFACDRLALNAEQRTRHFNVLGPALRSRTKAVRELADGYEFEFPDDAATFQIAAEWARQEQLCCSFFDVALIEEREDGSLRLRLTGREGVKQFIRSEFAAWFK